MKNSDFAAFVMLSLMSYAIDGRGCRLIVADYCANKHSNMDFSVGVGFPYESCKKIQSPLILNSIAAAWLACLPYPYWM